MRGSHTGRFDCNNCTVEFSHITVKLYNLLCTPWQLINFFYCCISVALILLRICIVYGLPNRLVSTWLPIL